MPLTIVVLGSLNMDFVVRMRELPAPGETVLGSDFQTAPGGKGANQAYAAGRMGGVEITTRMIGRVGADVFGEQLKNNLTSAGVDIDAVGISGGAPTGVALIWIDRAGQNSIVVASGANAAITADDVRQSARAFEGAALALFQLETPLAVVGAGLKTAKNAGARTILDPAPAQALSRDLFEQVDILTPNETEALILTGKPGKDVQVEDARGLAEALLEGGCGSVVLKLGAKGCFYSDGKNEHLVPGFRVATIDTTAAGDVFNGALAVGLAEGKAMPGALRFANAAAALSTTKPGAQSSVPRRSEVDAFLKSCAS